MNVNHQEEKKEGDLEEGREKRGRRTWRSHRAPGVHFPPTCLTSYNMCSYGKWFNTTTTTTTNASDTITSTNASDTTTTTNASNTTTYTTA